uniref:Dienelactone hydrolase domain-containing protein n=1 Tax=Salix viminalis TaxID=40686 RepID=A0A6N2MD05_SALVM
MVSSWRSLCYIDSLLWFVEHQISWAFCKFHTSSSKLWKLAELKVPISILGAEIDHLSPPALLKQFEEVLAKSEVDSFVKVFPKVDHGWTVRYNVEDEAAVKSAEEAHVNLLEWFAKYVK